MSDIDRMFREGQRLTQYDIIGLKEMESELAQLKQDGVEVRELFEMAKTSLHEEEQDNKRLQEEVKRLEAYLSQAHVLINEANMLFDDINDGEYTVDRFTSQPYGAWLRSCPEVSVETIQAESIEELIKEHSHDYDIGGIRTDAIKVSDANKYVDQLTGNKG